MSKDNKALDGMIAVEQAKLDKLEEKQNEIIKKIKACKANIEKYTMMKNNQRFNEISNVLDGKGLSIEDIISAVASGDLLTLQEKIENTENDVEMGNETKTENDRDDREAENPTVSYGSGV